MKQQLNKTYIGDGIYAEIKQGELKLTTEDGIDTTNVIIIEPDVWTSLKYHVEEK